ncbi:uncharacterized protein CC84DRAFT_1125527 [Paraphaeosphaeria sporulosa]|uniref:Uncharacterized protein n=1 Tax=Paraphaeosphaeria sporulosa TaxID=1460663 RepID=A0A177C8Z3_9PLEO|nr:uncharacterized protein CC84DRAFT_1125527 [Paraphaeosphaeria sporulosa]OAG03227.1 hypothetical protein CC84DRAFT_1125527 [Paraphaeosphaeria sporulosa]
MAGQSNGRAKKPSKAAPNGTANGHLNGHADKSRAAPAKQVNARRKPRTSWTGSFASLVARLASWYLIITLAFRCPSSLTKISDSSPQICKPYLHARSYAAPYVDPYYQTYVAPQVEKFQPYVDTFDQRVYAPVSTFTKNQYATYGARRVEQAQKYVEAEWARTARPQIQQLQNKAYAQYEHHLGPYVKTASDALGPYVEQTKASLVEIYHLSILPTYEALLPYGRQAYAQGHHATVHYIFPAVHTGRDATWKFVSRTLWPYVRVLYGDNVEPQLVRIRERLGRYKDQQKVESVLEAVGSSSSARSKTDAITSSATIASSVSSAVSSATESTKSGWGVFDDFFGAESSATPSEVETKSPTQPKQPQLTGAELREKLNQDLREWQTKFATAADKGADDLDVRVAEITKRQIENGVHGHGAAMIVQLEETAESTISSLKKFTKQTIRSLPEDATEEQLEKAHEKCITKMRELGLAVKEKSQAVRNWKMTFDQETDNLVRAAVGSTVEVLEKIHGLGLQEVGMRWAWLDGVEYKDWQNYHKLRDTLNEWQEEVEAVGAKHDGLKAAHEEAAKLEDKAMTIASTMVNELVRLKDVSKWKIWAGDQTDDFSDKKVPARAYNAAQQVISNAREASSQASEAILGSEIPASESIASAAKASASSVSSILSDKIVGSETPAAESVASAAKASASSASSQLSNKIVGSETPVAESVASAAKQSASDAASKVSEAVVGSETPATESIASVVKSQVSNAAENIESATEVAKKSADAAASAASGAPKKVWGGVNAQVLVEAREPVFDDVIEDDEEGTYSEKVQSMVANAGDRASDLSRAVSEALLGATKTQGTAESVTSLASEQYVKALAAASSVLYGSQQAPLDSATSIASDKFASAVTAASYAIYGTPTPTAVIQTVRTHASSRYNEAVSIANAQFENAKSQFSVLVSGTTKPAHETMLAMIEKAYSDSLAAASERLDAALQYTESVKSYAAGPTQGYFESVSSIASSRLSEGLSQATAQFSSEPTDSPVLDGARRQYYEAIGLAHARYSEFLGAASTAVYGPEQGTFESLASVASESAASVAGSAQSYASDVSDSAQSAAAKAQEAAASLASQVSSGVIGSETAWTESVASQASQNWEALIAKASNQVYGAPTPWAASVYSQAGEYAAQATAQAAEQAAAVQALISELVIGKEPDFTESVMARFSAAYYTALPAAVSSVNSIASENIAAVTSYAGESFEAASEFAAEAYASASSVVESVFVPPPAIETIISNVNEQLNAAVESASAAVYGTQKGTIEQASESVVNAYASVQSKASEAIYGTAQASHDFAAVASSAQAAISEAIFGTPAATGISASAANGAAAAASVYSSVASVASEKAANAAAAASEAIYGPKQGAVESASARLAAAVEAANSRISELYAAASTNAEAVASSASSVAAEATKRVKDEL